VAHCADLPVILSIRAHRGVRAGVSSVLMSAVGAMTTGRVVQLPQLLEGAVQPVDVTLIVALAVAPITAAVFGGDTLRLEAGARRPLGTLDAVLTGLIFTPVLLAGSVIWLCGESAGAAGLVSDCAAFMALTLALLAVTAPGIAAGAPVAYFLVIVTAGYTPDGKAPWWHGCAPHRDRAARPSHSSSCRCRCSASMCAGAGTPSLARVRLRPMTEDEFEQWWAGSVESFAQNLARATGISLDAARERARLQGGEMLPMGVRSADVWLMTICDDDDAAAGALWIGRQPGRDDCAFIYDIAVAESRRGEGLGRAAMLAAEDLVRDAGFREIGLSVFGFNEPARRLYDSLDYRVVATQMTKRLD
jgi:ribosomal protein S18 acetylase RimI-like enzyme